MSHWPGRRRPAPRALSRTESRGERGLTLPVSAVSPLRSSASTLRGGPERKRMSNMGQRSSSASMCGLSSSGRAGQVRWVGTVGGVSAAREMRSLGVKTSHVNDEPWWEGLEQEGGHSDLVVVLVWCRKVVCGWCRGLPSRLCAIRCCGDPAPRELHVLQFVRSSQREYPRWGGECLAWMCSSRNDH
jgi:hypothetical protein